ncbi:hypothetical protein GTY75_04980 [Streptomyces sp. SID8381]|uniref:hypothetical protein n=1 Tax=unclassified Streptomyces TaxID=2593676 RepID=UPI00036A66E3|nr:MULTISPECIES: hypothetical protein [unclassified Streptomyces]MYX26028.1 hypothetical protein [Streptomyces sp. SID8381]
MTVEQRIQDLVIRWLHREHGINAVSARIDEDDWEIKSEQYGYCDTCGYEENYLELTVWYSVADEAGQRYIEVRKDPLSFLAELLRLEDEAV